MLACQDMQAWRRASPSSAPLTLTALMAFLARNRPSRCDLPQPQPPHRRVWPMHATPRAGPNTPFACRIAVKGSGGGRSRPGIIIASPGQHAFLDVRYSSKCRRYFWVTLSLCCPAFNETSFGIEAKASPACRNRRLCRRRHYYYSNIYCVIIT